MSETSNIDGNDQLRAIVRRWLRQIRALRTDATTESKKVLTRRNRGCLDAYDNTMRMWTERDKERRETNVVYLVVNALYNHTSPFFQAELPTSMSNLSLARMTWIFIGS